MKKIDKNNLEENLKSLSIEPTKPWVDSTRSKLDNLADFSVTNSDSERNVGVGSKFNILFFNFFAMTKKQIAITSVVGVVVTASLAVGGLLLINNLTNTTGSSTLALTEEQKREIYSNILANNSTSNLKPQDAAKKMSENSAPQTAFAETAGDLSILPYPMPYPVERDYTFSKSISATNTGPKAESCAAYGSTGIYANSSSEYYDYFESWDVSFSKSISRDSQGQLFNYYLNKNFDNKSESITYFGGQYAVKSTNEFGPVYYENTPEAGEIMPSISEDQIVVEPIIDPSPTTQDPLEYIKMLYGEDVDIVDLRTENGREVYVLRYSYEVDCNSMAIPFTSSVLRGGTQQNADMRIIFSEVVIDTATFQTLKTTTYLDSIDESNRMSTYETQFETSNMTKDEAVNFFQFEFSVPVREVIYPEYSWEKEVEAQKQAFNSARLPIYSVLSEGFSLNYSWVYFESDYAPNIDYWNDRSFYPSGSFGDSLFAENTFVSVGMEYTKQLANYSYSRGSWETSDNQSYDISIYDTADLEKLLSENNSWRDQGSLTRTNRSIIVNGVSVDAVQIRTEDRYSFPRIAVDGSVGTELEEQVWSYYTTYFVHAGKVVSVSFSDVNGSQPLPENFELSVVSYGEAGYEAEKQKIFDSWTNQSFGVAEPKVAL